MTLSLKTASLKPRPHRLRRSATVLAATAAALVLGAGTAFAHVSLTPTTAAPGSYTTLSFRVPNESDTATTTQLEIKLPADTPFGFVSAKQAPGWNIEVVTSTLPTPVTQGTTTLTEAVTSVTFTAITSGLAPHQFTTFDLLVGPVPEVPSISFAAVQTYDDGAVVSWDQPTPASGEEPEHPAPVLTVSGAEVTGDDDDAGPTVTATSSDSAAAAGTSSGGTDVLARVLGVIGIVVGLFGAGMAIGIGAGKRKKAAAAGGDQQK